MGELCAALERAAGADSLAEASARLAELEETFARVRAAVAAMRTGPGT
jgi:hypothetical protein